MRLRLGTYIKSMIGPDLPAEAVLGVGAKDAKLNELFMATPVQQEKMIASYEPMTQKVWLAFFSSFLAYTLLKAGEETLTLSLDKLQALTDEIQLIAEIDREKRQVYFHAVGKEKMSGTQDSDSGLGTPGEGERLTE